MVHDLSLWEHPSASVISLDRKLITLFCPRSKSLPEIRTQRDFEIYCKIYNHSIRIGDKVPGWEIKFALEFMMNTDAKLFPPREKWETKGYVADVFGRWIGRDGDLALPLYEGVMVSSLDPLFKSYSRSARSNSASWSDLQFDYKQVLPRYLMSQEDSEVRIGSFRGTKLGFRDIARATDERSMISAVLPDFPCGNTAATLTLPDRRLDRHLLLAASLDSLSCDYVVRQRLSGMHLNWFIVDECAIPAFDKALSSVTDRLLVATGRLSLIHRLFSPEWLKLKHLHPELASKEWKHWWAVTEADRLRLRVEIDALCLTSTVLTPTTSTGSCGTTPPTLRASTGWTASFPSGNASPASPPPPSVR